MTTSEGQSRSRNYLNQLKGSVVFKGLAVLASFLVIPLMITYLGKERFGIWSTLLTIMSWVILFDLGIGNGLRNRVAEALAEGRQDEARDYISAGYTLIGLIALLVLVSFEILSFFVVWQDIIEKAFARVDDDRARTFRRIKIDNLTMELLVDAVDRDCRKLAAVVGQARAGAEVALTVTVRLRTDPTA